MKRQIGAAVDLVNYARVCSSGTKEELEHLLVNEHADPNEFRGEFKDGGSPLIMVCIRGYENGNGGADTLDMARLLLHYGATTRASDDCGDTALHCACLWATLDLVKLLVDHGAHVGAMNKANDYPIDHVMSDHCDNDEAFRIVSYLVLDCNAPVYLPFFKTIVRRGDPRILEMLLASRSKAITDVKKLFAIASGMSNGANMLRALMAAFPNQLFMTTWLKHAFGASKENMELLLPRFSAAQVEDLLSGTTLQYYDHGDVMARAELALQRKMLKTVAMRTVLAARDTPNTLWCALRIEKNTEFNMGISSHTNLSKWYWLGSHFQSQQFYKHQNNTLLHLASIHKTAALRVLSKHEINPLLKNDAGKLAIDLVPAADTEARAFLQTYMQWRPTRVVTDWFGPYFIWRARAFLRVCVRLDPKGELLQRDVRHKIIRYMAENECVSI